jgi:hypothetical protein
MKNLLYSSISAFFLVLTCCVIIYTYRESKNDFKLKIHSNHELSVKVSSIEEAVDYLMICDSIMNERERQWRENQRKNRGW